MKSLTRVLLLAAGTLSLVLAVIGIVIPVLPTTPFLLLAALCYGRSSQRCHDWLLHNRWFGAYIRNYREGRGIPMRQKILTIVALWLTIGSTVLVAVTAWWGKIGLIAITSAVTLHLSRIRTYRPDAADEVRNAPKAAEFDGA